MHCFRGNVIRLDSSPFRLQCVWSWESVLLSSLCVQKKLAQPRHVDHLVGLGVLNHSFRALSHRQKDRAEHARGHAMYTFTTWLVARGVVSGPRPHLVQHLLHLVHSALRRLGLLLNLAKRPGKLQHTFQYPLREENLNDFNTIQNEQKAFRTY